MSIRFPSQEEVTVFSEIPFKSIDHEKLSIYFRLLGKKVWVEAIGPSGERVEVEIEATWDADPNGNDLGEALMPGDILKLYTGILQRASKNSKGIRIELDFTGAPDLAHLPWEKARIGGQSVVADPRLSITRTVSSQIPALPFEANQKPYRILFVLANPRSQVIDGKKSELAELNLEADYLQVKNAVQALVDQEMVELIKLEGQEATLENLVENIQKQEIHSLMFAGNGFLGKPGDTAKDALNGYIVLDDGKGEAQYVSGQDILNTVNLSRDSTDVRLVFLNACHTAYGKNSGEGVAEAFLRAGVPAVVAYNSLVADDIASIFAGAFFSALVERNSLELAMYEGRKAMTQANEFSSFVSWSDPLLFSRVRSGKKAFGGDLIAKVATYVNEKGELEVMEQQENQTSTELFNKLLKSITARVEKISDSEKYALVQNQIIKANRELRRNPDQAIDFLSDASMHVARAIKEQEAVKKQIEQREIDAKKQLLARRALLKKRITQRSIVLGMAGLMFVLIGFLSYFLEKPETYTIKILYLPIQIVLWSFIGGVGATLYAFVGTQNQSENEPLRLDWLIGRPLVGIIMGSVVYLTLATSINALTKDPIAVDDLSSSYLLFALAFLGGFSDKFAILLFSNLVGKYTTGGKEEQDVEKETIAKENIKEHKPLIAEEQEASNGKLEGEELEIEKS